MAPEIPSPPRPQIDYRPYTGVLLETAQTIIAPSHQTKNYISRPGRANFAQIDQRIEVFSPDAQQMFWDLFYRSKGTGSPVYPNRNYLRSEFPELFQFDVKSLLEIGCGNGSTIVPLVELQANCVEDSLGTLPALHSVTGLDISWTSLHYCLRAIEKVCREGETPFELDVVEDSHITIRIKTRLHVALVLGDITSPSLLAHTLTTQHDAVSMIFVLSALPPQCAQHAIRNAYGLLSPQGYLFYRDYDVDDVVKSDRMTVGSAASQGEYECFSRKNGTLITLYGREYLVGLFESVGFRVVSKKVVKSRFSNAKLSKSWERAYFQCVVRKV